VLKNDATGLGSSPRNDAGSGEGDLEVVDEAPSETSQEFYSCYPQISNITGVVPECTHITIATVSTLRTFFP
jgi:hypothetical protein